jgi:quercetin dioxygenase-like cupin family protein
MPIINLKDIKEQHIVAGFDAKFVHTENMTLAYWKVKKDAILPKHSHMHEQVTHVIKGEFELTIGEETKICKPGMVAVIPANIEHHGKALTDCDLLDVFYPIREDYKN